MLTFLILLHFVYLCLQCCTASCDIKNTFDCYEMRNDSLLRRNVSSTCNEDIKFNSTWQYLENGELNFTMEILNIGTNCDIKLSYIELRKILPENDTECIKTGPPYLHSKYTCRDIENLGFSNDLYTKKKINVIFKYIYTGCYWVTLHFKGQERFREFPYFWNTTYKKTLFNLSENKETTYQGKPSNGLNLMIKRPILKEFPEISITVIDWDKTNHQPKFWLQPSKRNDKLLEICDQNLRANKSNLNVKCSWDKEQVEPYIFCRIFPLRNNSINYHLTIEFLGDPIRCSMSPIWRTECRTFRNLTTFQRNNIPYYDNTVHVIVLSSSVVFGGLGLLLAVFIIILYIRFKNGEKNNGFINEYSSKEKMISTEQIILIYAKDCPVIMDALTSFRNLLINTGYTVQDIFTNMKVPIDFNSLSRDIQRNDVKIIVFLNPCGHKIITTPLKENQHWVYTPTTNYQDEFFPKSLLILQNPSNSTKIILAKFEFDYLCYDSVKSMSSNGIYNLPTNIHSLLQKVGSTQNLPENAATNFRQKYEKARSYCVNNPRYGYVNELIQIHTLISTLNKSI